MLYRWQIDLIRARSDLVVKTSDVIQMSLLSVLKKNHPDEWKKLMKMINEIDAGN